MKRKIQDILQQKPWLGYAFMLAIGLLLGFVFFSNSSKYLLFIGAFFFDYFKHPFSAIFIYCCYLIISISIAWKSYAFFRHIFDIYLYFIARISAIHSFILCVAFTMYFRLYITPLSYLFTHTSKTSCVSITLASHIYFCKSIYTITLEHTPN